MLLLSHTRHREIMLKNAIDHLLILVNRGMQSVSVGVKGLRNWVKEHIYMTIVDGVKEPGILVNYQNQTIIKLLFKQHVMEINV